VDATTAEPGEFSRGLWLHKGVAESIRAGDPQAAYRYSHQLVKMPYETFMNRNFPQEPKLEPLPPISEPCAIGPRLAARPEGG
jgi:hypothetical protein